MFIKKCTSWFFLTGILFSCAIKADNVDKQKAMLQAAVCLKVIGQATGIITGALLGALIAGILTENLSESESTETAITLAGSCIGLCIGLKAATSIGNKIIEITE